VRKRRKSGSQGKRGKWTKATGKAWEATGKAREATGKAREATGKAWEAQENAQGTYHDHTTSVRFSFLNLFINIQQQNCSIVTLL